MQEAKARISELVKCAQYQPEDITVHAKSIAVVVSCEVFDRLSLAQGSLVDFIRRSPLYDADDIELKRDTSTTREVGVLSYLINTNYSPNFAIKPLIQL